MFKINSFIILIGAYLLFLISWRLFAPESNKIQYISIEATTDFKAIERAYFKGQRDYMNGDIRVGRVDSCFFWIKSPWNDGKEPEFDPKCDTLKNKVKEIL